jgi:tetratricopeptide (TPR) repeat protein
MSGGLKLEDLMPLYQAIAHGCRAGRHQEAMDEIYKNRICRRLPGDDLEYDGGRKLEYYGSRKLGALGTELAAIFWFFDRPEIPSVKLKEVDQRWVLSQAGFYLRALGRLDEALSALREALRLLEGAEDWKTAAARGSHVSEVQLLMGMIPDAVATGEKSVDHADRSKHKFRSPDIALKCLLGAQLSPRRCMRQEGARRLGAFSSMLSSFRRNWHRHVRSTRCRATNTVIFCWLMVSTLQ